MFKIRAFARPHPESLIISGLLTILVALGQIATGTYLPSLPSLVADLQATPAEVNLTLTVFLAAFAVSQLIYGPLSDRFGRRRVLLGGLCIYLAASVACTFAPDIESLIAGRFAQAVGACSGPVIGRAIVRDVYGRERAAKVLSYLGVAFAVSPAVMPIIGGYLQVWFGWRAVFLFLSAVAGSVLFTVAFILEETNRNPDRRALDIAGIGRNYRMLLGSAEYLGYAFSVAFVFAGLMAYIATSPFLFIDTFGLSPDQYGLLAMFNVTGFLAGNLTSGRFTVQVGVERMVLLGVSLSLAGGLAMVATALLGGTGVFAVIFPMILFLAGMGLVFPNAMAGALGPFPKAAGAASALLGFFQMTAAAVSSAAAGLIVHTTQLPMALSITAVSAAAFLAFVTLSWPRRAVKAEGREPRPNARPR